MTTPTKPRPSSGWTADIAVTAAFIGAAYIAVTVFGVAAAGTGSLATQLTYFAALIVSIVALGSAFLREPTRRTVAVGVERCRAGGRR